MNTYRAPVRCIICGDGEITSSEGTTQGDPLAMAMYALAVKPLIGALKSDTPGVKQVWYADDATGAGTCDDLRKWWEKSASIWHQIWIPSQRFQNPPRSENRARSEG